MDDQELADLFQDLASDRMERKGSAADRDRLWARDLPVDVQPVASATLNVTLKLRPQWLTSAYRAERLAQGFTPVFAQGERISQPSTGG